MVDLLAQSRHIDSITCFKLDSMNSLTDDAAVATYASYHRHLAIITIIARLHGYYSKHGYPGYCPDVKFFDPTYLDADLVVLRALNETCGDNAKISYGGTIGAYHSITSNSRAICRSVEGYLCLDVLQPCRQILCVRASELEEEGLVAVICYSVLYHNRPSYTSPSIMAWVYGWPFMSWTLGDSPNVGQLTIYFRKKDEGTRSN